MAIIEGIVAPEDAVGEVKELYERSVKRFGFVPDAMQMQSINPDTIKFYAGLQKYFIEECGFSEKLKLLTNELSANTDGCSYCVSVMQAALHNKFGIDKAQLEELVQDPSKAPLDEKEKTLLLFMLKVAKDSNSTTKEDIHGLHGVGYSDKDIFNAINFVTTLQKMHNMLNALKIGKE